MQPASEVMPLTAVENSLLMTTTTTTTLPRAAQAYTALPVVVMVKVIYGASYSNNSSRDREIMAADDYAGGRTAEESPRSGKKRFRTKFTTDQKEKMLAFAEKLGWTLQRKDQENETERFCREVGVSRKVFKVWMHNHKNNTSSVSTGNASSLTQ